MTQSDAINLNGNKLNAHTPSKEAPDRWHSLEDHSINTAKMAYAFAKIFGAGSAAFILGIFHDLGKVSPSFQEYLKACHRGEKGTSVPHAVCGAAYLWSILLRQNNHNTSLSLCALGHHSGLSAEHQVVTKGGELDQWWNDDGNNQLKKFMCNMLQKMPLKTPKSLPRDNLRREFRLRMLFSSLVDADYLNTENHFNQKRSAERSNWIRPADLWPIFRADQLNMMWRGRGEHINQIRRQIYFSCIRSGQKNPGVFRLTVPTGGGKTRSGLAFALSHAVANKSHGFRRIIIAVPYTSIIDQNAQVYRKIFSDRFVLEHHSQIEIGKDEYQDEAYLKQKLAAENWDYPLIVTTTVQLFESLFSNKPGRCRKLHNIANSILILDETQTLPSELLKPTMDVLRTLVDEYGVTLIFSTATQPAFDQTPYLDVFDGLDIHEIVNNYKEHFKKLKRVNYQPVRQLDSLIDLADELAQPDNFQTLVILNTRKHALELHKELQSRQADGLYHLSTLLCGAHRKQLLREITDRLSRENPLPVRLVSTQVVEAGVDLDFPVVYRAMGPLDRIVQAAGRCNREGKRRKNGEVTIFDFPDNASPPGAYKMGLEAAKTILERIKPGKLHDPEVYTEFFQMLFRDVDLDKKEIQPYRYDLDFPKVAKKYKLIENTIPVVIPSYDNNEGERRLLAYTSKPSRKTRRRLMPYIINLGAHELKKTEISECLEAADPFLYRWVGEYDDKTHRGIQGIVRDPADLIIGD